MEEIINKIADEMSVSPEKVAVTVSLVWDGLAPEEVDPSDITPERVEQLRREVHAGHVAVLAYWHPATQFNKPYVVVAGPEHAHTDLAPKYELPVSQPTNDAVDDLLFDQGWRRVEPWVEGIAEVVRVKAKQTSP